MGSTAKPIVILVLAAIIGLTYSKACSREDTSSTIAPATATPATAERTPIEPAPVEHAPTFINRETEEPAKRRTERAMRAVYDQCAANHHAIREGSRVEGSHVDKLGKLHELVNVQIDLARPDAANGNTLWFQVDLTAKPPTVAATKDIAARLCGLPGREHPISFPSAVDP